MLVLGLMVLTLGAELLVRGSSKLAITAGISPLVVGLTVVAFGTSAPELVVSVQSSLEGQSDVALGNVVGSNICNILLILGVSALIIPLRVSQQLVRFDVPLMIAVSLLFFGLAQDGKIGRVDGSVLIIGMIAYSVWAIINSRREQSNIQAEYEAEFGVRDNPTNFRGICLDLVTLIIGLGLLVLGARWFLGSAVEIARLLGVSELVIGLTVVASGTSLPEVATSIMAAVRGERDIAVGNAVGSNLFNIMGVLGIAGAVSPEGVSVSKEALTLDIPIMIAVAIACLPIFFTGHLIARWEGGMFLAYYIAYTAYLVLSATVPAISRTFATVMVGVVIPLTLVTLLIAVVRHMQIDKSDPDSSMS